MRELLIATLGVVIPLWLLVMAVLIMIGFAARPEECARPLVRLEYAVPGFQLGCWLREVP